MTVGDRAAVAYTDGGGLNLRYDAGYDAGIITVVPEGDVVSVIDGPVFDADGTAWYQVDYAGTDGWVHGGYLAWTDQAPTSSAADTPDTSDSGGDSSGAGSGSM